LTAGLKSFWTGWPYYPFLCAAAVQLAWQISTVELSNRSDCNRKYVFLSSSIQSSLAFKNVFVAILWEFEFVESILCRFVSNKWFGALVFSGILFGRLVSWWIYQACCLSSFVSYIDGFNVETKTILWLWEEYTKRFTMWTSNCSLVRNGLCKLHLRMAGAYILAKLLFWHNLCFWSRLFSEHVIVVLSTSCKQLQDKGQENTLMYNTFFLYPYVLLYVKTSVRAAFFWIV